MYDGRDPGDLLVFNYADQEQLDDSERVSGQAFTFTPYSTRYVFLEIRSTWGNTSFVSAAQVAFAQSATPVPFEFGPIPGIIGIVAVRGINYFRNKKGVKDK